MPAYIIHKDGVYNFYTTISDGCYFVSGITLDQLREYTRQQEGESGLQDLPNRLERAHATGCSGFNWTLDACISGNRAGPSEAEVPRDAFIAKYLSLEAAA